MFTQTSLTSWALASASIDEPSWLLNPRDWQDVCVCIWFSECKSHQESHIFFRLICVVLYCLMFVSGKFLMPGQIRRYRWMLLAFARLSQPGVVFQTFKRLVPCWNPGFLSIMTFYPSDDVSRYLVWAELQRKCLCCQTSGWIFITQSRRESLGGLHSFSGRFHVVGWKNEPFGRSSIISYWRLGLFFPIGSRVNIESSSWCLLCEMVQKSGWFLKRCLICLP